jgi:hypothetical protein
MKKNYLFTVLTSTYTVASAQLSKLRDFAGSLNKSEPKATLISDIILILFTILAVILFGWYFSS